MEGVKSRVLEPRDVKEAVSMIAQTIKGDEAMGLQRATHAQQTSKIIIAKAIKDWVEPYNQTNSVIPIVIFSTHPDYPQGTRLDYGFHSIIYRQGYTLFVIGCDLWKAT